MRFSVVVVAVAVALSRASGPHPVGLEPAAIAALEAHVAEHPDDPALTLRLVKGYYSAARLGDARRALEPALQAQPASVVLRYDRSPGAHGVAMLDAPKRR